MNQYMLMFSLGPVQPFIEQARKTRDLWLGSFLLSKLMEAAMENIEEPGVQFVFPANRKMNSKYANLPNKYIAIFPDLKKAENAAIKSRNQIYKYWGTLSIGVWDEVVKWCADSGTEKIWKRQTNPNACFEIRWVIVEGDADDPNKYKDWLEHTEQALEARKRLHNFQQSEEPGEKSVISGEHQALCWSANETAPSRHQVRAFWEVLATRKGHPQGHQSLSAKEISLEGSERLDAIDTIKRFATKSKSSQIDQQPFPSTSSIATATFVEGLLSPELDQASLQTWLTATSKPFFRDIPDGSTKAIPYLAEKAKRDNEVLRRDGDCFFRATFTPHRLKKDYGVADEAQAHKLANDGKRGLETLLEATDKLGIRRPTPYYAILKMDGDRMGTLLNTAKSMKEHQKISNALSEFTSIDVRELVNVSYPGRLVYAGGDDILALVPLARNFSKRSEDQSEAIKTVIDLANRLQQQYRKRMGQTATASISIAIAHHYAPLSFVLGVMRRAERHLAKKRYERNALVVSLIRRSGAQTQIGCRWEYPASEEVSQVQPVKLFLRFYELFEQDILSPKCVQILLEEAPALVSLERSAQSSEIRRVLLRQSSESKSNELSYEKARELADQLTWLAQAMNKAHTGTDKSILLEADGLRDGLIEVLGWLLVMAFITRTEED